MLYLLAGLSLSLLEEVAIIKSSFVNLDAFFLLLDVLGSDARQLKALVIEDGRAMWGSNDLRLKERFSHKVKAIL